VSVMLIFCIAKCTPIEDFASRLSKMRASPNAPLQKISLLGCLACTRGAQFRIAKRISIEDFASRASEMRAWCSFLHCKIRPDQRFRPSSVQMRAWCSFLHRQTYLYLGFIFSSIRNASVVLSFALQNAPLVRVEPPF